MHSPLTLDLKEGEDLILLTQTKHLSFKKHKTEVNQFLQKKKKGFPTQAMIYQVHQHCRDHISKTFGFLF